MMKVRWYDETKTIVHVEYEGRVNTWDEYILACMEANNLAKSVDHPLAILHTPLKTAMPAGNPLPHVKASVEKYTPSNVLIVATVITNPFARMMTNVVVRNITDRRIEGFNDTSTALQTIKTKLEQAARKSKEKTHA